MPTRTMQLMYYRRMQNTYKQTDGKNWTASVTSSFNPCRLRSTSFKPGTIKYAIPVCTPRPPAHCNVGHGLPEHFLFVLPHAPMVAIRQFLSHIPTLLTPTKIPFLSPSPGLAILPHFIFLRCGSRCNASRAPPTCCATSPTLSPCLDKKLNASSQSFVHDGTFNDILTSGNVYPSCVRCTSP